MPKFKTGDIVRYTEVRVLSPGSKSAHVGALAEVGKPAYIRSSAFSFDLLNVRWIRNPLPEQNPINQNDGGYFEQDFELAVSASQGFTLKLPTYTDVDEATELATRIATQYNIPVEVIRV